MAQGLASVIAVVTGGNGFVGRAIVERLLAAGDEVRVIGRARYHELERLGVRSFTSDLAAQQDLRAVLRGAEVVFHVAAKAGVWGKSEDFHAANVTGTQHVVREAIRAGVPKLVYTSSPSVVIGEEEIANGDESLPYPAQFSAPYPLTKSIAERFVLAQHEILACALRPHLIWGPRDPHILPRLIERAKRGRLVRVGDGRNKVDISYVENVAIGHIQAAAALRAGGVVAGRAYFIGQAEPVVLWDFIGELLRQLELAPVRHSLPLPLALTLATFFERFNRQFQPHEEPALTRFTASQLARSHWFSHAAASRDFGYCAPISTAEGLVRTVHAFRGTMVK